MAGSAGRNRAGMVNLRAQLVTRPVPGMSPKRIGVGMTRLGGVHEVYKVGDSWRGDVRSPGTLVL